MDAMGLATIFYEKPTAHLGDVTHELVTTNFAPALRDLLSPHGGVESGLYNCQLILRWFSL
jgi:hypothetical protein